MHTPNILTLSEKYKKKREQREIRYEKKRKILRKLNESENKMEEKIKSE